MEYSILQEKKQRFTALLLGVLSLFIIVLFSFNIIGVLGLVASIGLLLLFLTVPLLVDKYKFFLFLWIFLGTLCESTLTHLVSFNFPLAALLAITTPTAVVLILVYFKTLVKEFPFIISLVIFLLLILTNFLRFNISVYSILNTFRPHFISLFLVFITYLLLKKSKNSLNTIYLWINILALMNAATVIFQKITGIGVMYLENIPRVPGILSHPNACASFINIYLLFAITVIFGSKQYKNHKLWVITCILSLLALILTFSKSAFVIFTINCAVITLLLPFKIKLRIWGVLLLGLTCLLVANFAFDLKIMDYFLERLANSKSFEWRLGIWNSLIRNMDYNTYLFGNGLGSATEYLYKLNPYDGSHLVHNGYLQIVYDYGVFGLIYILAYFDLFKKGLTSFFKNKVLENRINSLSLVLLSLFFLLQTLINEALNASGYTAIYWIVVTILYLKINGKLEDKEKQAV